MKLAEKFFKESSENKARQLREIEEVKNRKYKENEPKIIEWFEKHISYRINEAVKNCLFHIEIELKENYDKSFIVSLGKIESTMGRNNSFLIISWDLSNIKPPEDPAYR